VVRTSITVSQSLFSLHSGPAGYATLKWIVRFNNRRLFQPVGDVPPAESEIAYYQRLQESAVVARLKKASLRYSQGDSSQFAE
jgi:hypothetical protein